MTDQAMTAIAQQVATACRVMAEQRLVEHILGHISVRTDPQHLLVRCRGPRESGLRSTTAEDVRLVDLDGHGDTGEWTVPNELPIHTEALRARPDMTAVVHAHPPALVAFSLLGRELLPIYGAYDIPGARLAADGIPVWPRAALISSIGLAREMISTLGAAPVVVLRGHGLVSVAGGPADEAIARAVLQAVAVERLARTTLAVLQAGGTPQAIEPADLAQLPDLGGAFTVATMWRHLESRLADPLSRPR